MVTTMKKQINFTEQDEYDNSIIARSVAAENSSLRRALARATIQVSESKSFESEFLWFVSFRPRYFTVQTRVRGKKKYIISRGIKREKVTACKDWQDLLEQAKEDAELKWMLEYTDLCEEKLEFARENSYFGVPIIVNIEKYKEKYGSRLNGGLNYKIGEEDLHR